METGDRRVQPLHQGANYLKVAVSLVVPSASVQQFRVVRATGCSSTGAAALGEGERQQRCQEHGRAARAGRVFIAPFSREQQSSND
ncbi:hypothetical protein NDU88_003114 [Pleurodeles waltl]|uniref:Uncharacterized protein n=1 Tax=Pleurodeles waltl TaxID=8319 RepID=A0AAV7LHL9_PLEWA|nr:hypothetical protein NDU88_003114 [Pleurodeles waltl]